MSNAFVTKLRAYGPLTDKEEGLLLGVSGPSRTVLPYHDLIREGDEPGPLFIILEGWACRYKVLPNGSRQIVAFMLPGDFCDLHVGELGEMDHGIGTLTTCKIRTVPRDQVEALIVATPSLTKAFWRSQLIDEGVLRDWIVNIGRRDSLARVSHLMLELYVRMRNIGLVTGEACEMPLTQPVIADAVGLTAVHVNRMLKTLRDEGIMTVSSKTLKILNVGRLARLAGFDDIYLHRQCKRVA